jgi:ubiquinone/menaquinone biosynthesis C-methylase UbiE
MSGSTTHQREIIDQFTRQAAAFARLPAHSNEAAMATTLRLAEVGPDDLVLDVACGPGILACEMAKKAAHVTGVDLTPAMIAEARQRQEGLGLANVTWMVGDGEKLPWPAGSFTLVTSRYALHHMEDPAALLREMRRMARGDGRLLVIDATPEASKRKAYDSMEKLRDPSHVGALTAPQLIAIAQDAGLSVKAAEFYRLEMTLEAQLRASAIPESTRDRLRALFRADADGGADHLGMQARRCGTDIVFSYPISVFLFGLESPDYSPINSRPIR